MKPGSSLFTLFEPLHMKVDIVGCDEIGRGPTIQVILRHALFSKSLHCICLAIGESVEQHLKANVLVVARVIEFVQMMPSSKFAADAVPGKYPSSGLCSYCLSGSPFRERTVLRRKIPYISLKSNDFSLFLGVNFHNAGKYAIFDCIRGGEMVYFP